MSKNTSATSVSSPAKLKRTASEETKIKKLYEEQQINIKMGHELYGISEKINPIDPIPGTMKNFELDYEMSEVFDGQPLVLGDTIFKNRVPPISNLDGIRKLDVVKKGLIKAEIFRSMLRTIDSFRRPSDCFNIFCESLTEDQVTELHKGLQILTDLEKNLFCFETTAANGKRVLRVMMHKGARLSVDGMKKWGWNEEYVHFSMKKKNIPFKKPLLAIADVLKIQPKDIGFAQLKEAGPASIQRISVPKPEANTLLQLTKQPKFTVGNFEVKTDHIKIGDLEGNRYRIVLRGLSSVNGDQVNEYEQCLKFLQRNGFINYFGTKRFFNKKGVPVYQIGKALLCRNFEEAINLIMTPSKDDPSDVRAMKERWALSDGSPIKTLEGSEALKDEFEYKLVNKLQQNPDDLIGALEEVPLNMRLGYIFAYQSYIWNIIASQRVKRKGLKLFVGDIVLANKDKPIPPEFYEDFSIPLMSRSETLPPLQRDPKQKPNYKDAIKFITQEDIDQKKYTIQDLVLPLPGSEVLFPKNNDVGIWYTDFLSKDGLSKTRLSDKYCINGNEIVHNLNYFLHGTYRKLIVVPKGLKWEFKPYKKLNDNLLDKGERIKSEGPDKLALLFEFTLPADSYVQMAVREIVDLEKSGFNDIYEAHKKAVEEERSELERLDKEKRREKEIREKETREKKERERERDRIEKEKRAKSAKERLDSGSRSERLDGGLPKNRRESIGERRERSRELSHTSSTRRARSREVLDGRARRSRSNSPNRGFSRVGSREVMRNPNSTIKVRVDNDMIWEHPRSRSNEKSFHDEGGFQERFGRPDNRPTSIDGIPICEFNTQLEYPDIDDSFNNMSRNLSAREPFRGNSPGGIWDAAQQQQPLHYDDERQTMPFDQMQMSRQSVFDGRLEPRPILRNPDPPEGVEPGRLLHPSPFFRKPDEPRGRQSESGSYEIEREFDRFEQEVQELNRECIQAQEIRLRDALEQEERMRYGRNDLRDQISDVRGRDDRRRPVDGPLSPQIAEKLRRLDEEALRLDLKRVTRLQNFDASSNTSSTTRQNERVGMDFDRDGGRREDMVLGRDFGDDRNMPISREQVLNRTREMEEFERKFLMERENDRQMPSRDRMENQSRFDDRQHQQRRDDHPPNRFIEEIPFRRDVSEPKRAPSPPNKRQSVSFQSDRSFDQKNLQRPDSRDTNVQGERFGSRNMDQERPNEFLGGNNNNFGPRDSSSFGDMGNSLSRNNQPMSQFGQRPSGQVSYPNMNQGGRFGTNNDNNFGQGPPNQFRGDGMMQQQQQRGMDGPWGGNMMGKRSNSPPKQQFPNQQWMNQENPNFNPNNGSFPNQFQPNQMFGNNNGGPFGGGPGPFPNNNQQQQMMNNIFQNSMMGGGPGPGPGPGQGQGMMGMFQNNNNMQRGGPGNMQGMMDGRQSGRRKYN